MNDQMKIEISNFIKLYSHDFTFNNLFDGTINLIICYFESIFSSF